MHHHGERGGIRPAILIGILVAAAATAGALLLMRNDGDGGAAVVQQDSGVRAAKPIEVAAPEVTEAEAPAPPEGAEELMQGELVKWIDENGVTHFSPQQIFKGTTGTGKPLNFRVDMRIGPEIRGKEHIKKAKGQRKTSPKPPRLVMQDGKLVPSPNAPPAAPPAPEPGQGETGGG